MILFEHVNGDLRKAAFGGSLSELSADLCLEIALIYGSIKQRDSDAASAFKRGLISALVDDQIAGEIFSTPPKSSTRLPGLVITESEKSESISTRKSL